MWGMACSFGRHSSKRSISLTSGWAHKLYCCLLQVKLDVPQNSAMWEAFADCIAGIKAGKPPEPFWSHIACLTNKLVCCVLQSAEQGCIPVHFKA